MMTHTKPIPMSTKGLTPFEAKRLRNRLRRSAPSETWVDDQIITTTTFDPEGDPITHTHFDSQVFPPGGRQNTKMKWCRSCGRYTPSPAISLIEHRQKRFGPVITATLHCDDCRISKDETQHRELYHAGLHLKPAGSRSFVGLRSLRSERNKP